MLTAIRGSPEDIKEEMSMVRQEADIQFLEPDRLKMNKTCIGYTYFSEIFLTLLVEGVK